MNKKFILLPALAAAVLGITSCSTNKNKDTVDPSKPQGTEMTAEEIKAFGKKGADDYFFAHLDGKDDQFFKLVRSGKFETSTTMHESRNGMVTNTVYSGTVEFDLDKNYIYGVGTLKSDVTDGKRTESNTINAESYYELDNNVIKNYQRMGDDKFISDCPADETIENHLYETSFQLSGAAILTPIQDLEYFGDMVTKNCIKMYKEKDTYFADYNYTYENGPTFKNKIRYNKDYLPVYAELAGTTSSKTSGEEANGEMTSKFSFTPGAVTKKDFDKTGYTPVQYN